ncbi:GNAT family N-acetyltransferase [bacterium]|nr:GNAT family N-acetyltransferase [bacterium]
MIEEISQIHVDSIRFPGRQLEMVLTSIAEGNTNGRLWRIAGADESALYLLWDQGNNVFYIAGDVDMTTVQATAALIQSEIRESAIQRGRVYFKVNTLSTALTAAIPDLFPQIHLHEMNKLFYRFEQTAAPRFSAAVDGVRYQRIDADFLAQATYENIDAVKAETAWMWASSAAFHAHGFGYVAVKEDTIVCWCTAEYVSERMCGIGIETVPEFQNKGIATATAAHFVDECLRRRIVPHWECDGQNVGSMRVAEKVGFSLHSEIVVWGGRLDR